MKITILIIMVVLLTSFSCKSRKNTKKSDKTEEKTNTETNKPPLKISKATYQNWYGGVPGSRGVKIEINGSDLDKNIVFKHFYFNKKSAKIYPTITDNSVFLEANINTANKRDMMLHGNRVDEQTTTDSDTFEFPDLKENEAIFTYTDGGIKKTHRLILTKEKELYYP